MKNISELKITIKREAHSLSTSEKKVVKDALKVKPVIDFRFMHQSNKCFKYAYSCFKNKKDIDNFIDDFQEFVYKFSDCDSFSSALKLYSSHNSGSKLNCKDAKIKGVIDCLPSDVKQSIENDLIHLHIKPNGKGKVLVIGFTVGAKFFTLAIDVNHEII
nr:MAG TPA: hypothetical protein [Caudoviricetes sp.]